MTHTVRKLNAKFTVSFFAEEQSPRIVVVCSWRKRTEGRSEKIESGVPLHELGIELDGVCLNVFQIRGNVVWARLPFGTIEGKEFFFDHPYLSWTQR